MSVKKPENDKPLGLIANNKPVTTRVAASLNGVGLGTKHHDGMEVREMHLPVTLVVQLLAQAHIYGLLDIETLNEMKAHRHGEPVDLKSSFDRNESGDGYLRLRCLDNSDEDEMTQSRVMARSAGQTAMDLIKPYIAADGEQVEPGSPPKEKPTFPLMNVSKLVH